MQHVIIDQRATGCSQNHAICRVNSVLTTCFINTYKITFAANRSMSTITILVAEDDDSGFAELQQEFATLPVAYHLQRVKNGKLLLQFLSGLVNYKLRLPHLIVMNLDMPEVNGIETLELIKVNSYFSNIPVLIYSASIDKAQEHKCLALGAVSLVKKGKSNEEVSLFTNYLHDRITRSFSIIGNEYYRNAFADQVTL